MTARFAIQSGGSYRPGVHYASVWVPQFGTEAPEWTLAAACQFTDPELFFPEKGGSTREAKQVRAGCPVTAECLAFALEHQERFGIYGGLSERERRRLPGQARRRYAPRPIRHGTRGGYDTHRRRDEEPCGPCRAAASDEWARVKRRRSA